MTQHYRGQIRASTRLTLEHCAHFADCTMLWAWSSELDADALPILAVMTPSETKGDAARGSSERIISLQVLLRRLGGDDIEDILDHDSTVLEAAVLASLRTHNWGAELQATDVSIDQAGDQRVGSLDMKFLVTLWVAEPLTL